MNHPILTKKFKEFLLNAFLCIWNAFILLAPLSIILGHTRSSKNNSQYFELSLSHILNQRAGKVLRYVSHAAIKSARAVYFVYGFKFGSGVDKNKAFDRYEVSRLKIKLRILRESNNNFSLQRNIN